jgi:hypothetical protein
MYMSRDISLMLIPRVTQLVTGCTCHVISVLCTITSWVTWGSTYDWKSATCKSNNQLGYIWESTYDWYHVRCIPITSWITWGDQHKTDIQIRRFHTLHLSLHVSGRACRYTLVSILILTFVHHGSYSAGFTCLTGCTCHVISVLCWSPMTENPRHVNPITSWVTYGNQHMTDITWDVFQ